MGGQGHIKAHAAAEDAVDKGCHAVTELLRDKLRKGDADDHGDQLEGLPHRIRLRAACVVGEEFGEQRAVIGVDDRIQRACEDIEEHAEGHQAVSRDAGRRVEEPYQTKYQQWRTDHEPWASPAPTAAGAIGQETVDQVVSGIDEGINEEDQGEFTGLEAEFVDVAVSYTHLT